MVGADDVKHCLMGKVLSGKKVNREAFIGVIEQLWSTIGRVEIEAIGDNIFMFYFRRSEDWDLIWLRGPWHFVLERPERIGDISNLQFDKIDMWVHIHNLPLMCMNRCFAKLLAEQTGGVIEIPS
ncbi:hypothetical protein LWI28_014283 [Acer negundo]|uniref:DUF4283 domain-containing protein n=1 Tax=Acer negundo TaxID=4023 RepID=A0AAD5JDH7_ACENE|nr:hypothetical protein LWI28_014283 [Acer negundo]